MNEKIKELIDKATDNILGVPVVNQTKFAELIVQECADHINSSSDRYRREYFADKILTHFGIKQ